MEDLLLNSFNFHCLGDTISIPVKAPETIGVEAIFFHFPRDLGEVPGAEAKVNYSCRGLILGFCVFGLYFQKNTFTLVSLQIV